MVINALFDESFLQSLSVDESVCFDKYFNGIFCPAFLVEALADLSKNVRGRSSEDEVSTMAGKYLDVHGMPCSHHEDLYLAELFGDESSASKISVRVP